MGYLSDYVYYSSGTECPDEFIWWSGLSILGHILGRKVWVEHGDYFRISPNLYICLVGPIGSGKNTAISVPKQIMYDHFPEHLVSASIQSREDIADLMASDNCIHTWNDVPNPQEFRPFYILNNELASILSVDKAKMVEFLTELFDGKDFGTGFKGQRFANPERKQRFKNPHVSVLAGAPPENFMTTLRMDLFSGGLGRRLVIVHARCDKVCPVPTKPKGADEALERAIRHLRLAKEVCGKVTLNPDALKWWCEWYPRHKQKVVDDPILQQFKTTKHVQLLKIATVLHFSEYPFKKEMETAPLEMALHLLDKLEPEIQRLTSGIGPNELAGVAARLMDQIDQLGGAVAEKRIHKTFYRYVPDREWDDILRHLEHTDELIIKWFNDNGTSRRMLMTPEFAKQQEKENAKPPTEQKSAQGTQ